MKFKHLVVPTDFSEEANNALALAVSIARKSNAKISLLHVIDVPVAAPVDSLDIMGFSHGDESPDVYKHYMIQVMKATKHRINELIAQYPDVSISEHVEFDTLQKHLTEFVTTNETDLIVIGSKGASGLDEVVIGSNTEKVIRYAKAPVLTVKGKHEEAKFDHVVFASSFQNVSSKAINSLKTLQKVFGSHIHFVKVITPNTFEATPDTLKVINKFAHSHEFTHYSAHSYNAFSEEEGIRSFADTAKADLIVMSTNGRTGLAHLLLGSIAEEVANHAHLPVLTFNERYK